MSMAALHWLDYAVFTAYFVTSLGIGVYYAMSGGRQRSTKEFISGNNNMPIIPTMVSMTASFFSSVSLLGYSAEIFDHGTAGILALIVGKPIGSLAAERIYVPLIYKLRLVSMYEYLSMRYGSMAVRTIGVMLGLMQMIFYSGTCLFGPAIALHTISNVPIYITMLAMAAACIVYTALGGMKAVVYTDMFQSVIMIAGCMAVLIKGLLVVGGPTEAIAVTNHHGRINWASSSVDPRERHTSWGVFLGLVWMYSMVFGLSQTSVQRYSALPTLSKARNAVLWNGIPFMLLNGLAFAYAVTIFAYYASQDCDPLETGLVEYNNQLVPFFVMHAFKDNPGVAGLFMAALFGGAMSSISSCLSSASAIMWSDLFKAYRPNFSDKTGVIVNKAGVVLFGLLSLGVSFITAAVPSIPLVQTSITFIGLACGPLGALYILGATTRKANWKGALAGVLVGVAFNLWVGVGAMTITRTRHTLPPMSGANCSRFYSDEDIADVEHNQLYDSTTTAAPQLDLSTTPSTYMSPISGVQSLYSVSYLWYSLFGSLVTLLVGVPVSLLTANKADRIYTQDKRLFFHVSDFIASPCAEEDEDETMPRDNKGTLDAEETSMLADDDQVDKKKEKQSHIL